MAGEARLHDLDTCVVPFDRNARNEATIPVNIASVNLRALIEEHHTRKSARGVVEGLSPLRGVDSFDANSDGTLRVGWYNNIDGVAIDDRDDLCFECASDKFAYLARP